MSDRYSRLFAEYALSVSWDKLPPETVHEVKRRIVDSVGVAFAALHSDTAQAVRKWVYTRQQPAGAHLWGMPVRVDVEAAAFYNGVLVRYLDFNDTYLSLEPLHPSDMIPALMAVAEAYRLPATDLLTAIAIGYEIGVCLCDAASLRKHRWDHVNYIGIATAVAAGWLLGRGLPDAVSVIENAVSIAAVPHASMRQTRAGELSMWKGCAAANSARNGVFAALLASCSLTGPYEPFEGEMGFFRQLLGGERFNDDALKSLYDRQPPHRILDTYIKFWPVEYHAQSAVDAALQLHREIGDPSSIEKIHIDTFRASYEIIAKDPQKWEPQTRETADHSLPYITVAALLDGRVTPETFSKERIFDPHLRKMLKENTTLSEDPELTSGYPEGIPNRITVTLKDGTTLTKLVKYPRGHARNPMSDEEVFQKFRDNLERVGMGGRAEQLFDFIMGIDRQGENWTKLFDLLIF